MTGIAIKDIPGALVDTIYQTCGGEKPQELGEYIGYTRCRTQQGEVQLTLNKEKLRIIISQTWIGSTPTFIDACVKAIKSNEKDLIEVIK